MKQHPLCTDTEHEHDVMNLPVPSEVKREWAALQTRRHFLGRSGKVLGWAAIASLLGNRAMRGDSHSTTSGQPGSQAGDRLRLPHFAPKAKRAIYLFMSGGPSQVDLFDYKPHLNELYDKDIPDSVRGAQQLTGMTAGQARFPVAPSRWGFKRYGQTGTWVSDLLPYTGRIVDDLLIIKSTNTEAINHEPAITFMQTGNQNTGRPCFGSWTSYGLGTMNENLPTFVVLEIGRAHV